MKNRFKDVRLNTGLNQAEFGKKIGVTRDTIANIEGGRMQIKDIYINSVCREFDINETWLRTGEGDMKAPPSREQEIADMVSKLVKLDPNDEADQLMYDTLMHLKDVPKSVWEDFLQFIKEEIPKLNLK